MLVGESAQHASLTAIQTITAPTCRQRQVAVVALFSLSNVACEPSNSRQANASASQLRSICSPETLQMWPYYLLAGVSAIRADRVWVKYSLDDGRPKYLGFVRRFRRPDATVRRNGHQGRPIRGRIGNGSGLSFLQQHRSITKSLSRL